MNGMNSIAERLIVVRERIAEAAVRSGRQAKKITLVAVTKTVEPVRIAEAVAAGVVDLGENYYQEAREKQTLFPEARWHFIGHLQTNKAKYVAGAFHLIQSVDSEELAAELERRAARKEIVQNFLLEVKLDPSAAKYGVEPAKLPALVEFVRSCSHLNLQGLMGMPPLTASADEARPYFQRLRRTFEELPEQNRSVLSMGMTADFEAAIEEGSTMVRIGAAIFGRRN